MLQLIWHYLTVHSTPASLVAFWLASNFVSSLPSPSNDSGGFYKWFFAFTTSLVGSIPRLLPGARLPGDATRGSSTYFTNGGNK